MIWNVNKTDILQKFVHFPDEAIFNRLADVRVLSGPQMSHFSVNHLMTKLWKYDIPYHRI